MLSEFLYGRYNKVKKNLDNFDKRSFLENIWQKKPLVVRQAIPDFDAPISPDELAGLALEDDVESRLIIEHGETPWELKHGPFSEDTFATLPDECWTLLVQSVDHWVPEVHDLLDYFRFLPSWRVEDIMISYAVNGGNVGPHYDHFDVFLIQAQGKRRWQIGPVYDESAAVVSGTPLHILSAFSASEEYLMEPGDILYLPPGVGHHGVAEGECMTISVGFRAPAHGEILMGFTDYVADKLSKSLRYSDPGLSLSVNPGAIDQSAIQQVRRILQTYLENENDNDIAAWFGKHMTEPRQPQVNNEDISDWSSVVSEFASCDLRVSEGTRIAFYNGDVSYNKKGKSYVFVDGEKQLMSETMQPLVERLCSEQMVSASQWCQITDSKAQCWLLNSLRNGSLYFEAVSDV